MNNKEQEKDRIWYYYDNENNNKVSIEVPKMNYIENTNLLGETDKDIDEKRKYEKELRKAYLREYERVCKEETQLNSQSLFIQNIEENSSAGKLELDWQAKFFELVKSKVSKFLGNFPYNNIILFLGSGASIKGEDYGKTMKGLVKKIKNDLERRTESKKGDIDYDKILSVKELSQYDLSKKKKSTKKEDSDFNLESVITQLELEKDSKNTKSLDLERIKNTLAYIKYKIFKEVNYEKIDSNDFSHGAIMNYLIKKLKDNGTKLNVVTTNYDTVVEKVAAENGYILFDGFGFDSAHEFDDDIFDWNLTKQVAGVNTKEQIYKDKVINLLKLHGSIDWEDTGTTIRKTSAQKMEEKLLSKVRLVDEENNKIARSKEKNNVTMIFPSSNKYEQSYKEPYFDLLHRFQDILHIPSTLLITSGFSFSDDHLSRMIFNAIRHNSDFKCLVCDYNINPFIDQENKEVNSNQKELFNLSKNGYQISYLKAAMNSEDGGLDFYFKGTSNEKN